MARLVDLEKGDVLLGSLRLSFALKTVVDGRGQPYRIVPSRPSKCRNGDLPHFIAWLVSYDTSTGVLFLETQNYTQGEGTFVTHGPCLRAAIHKTALKRLRRISHAAREPQEHRGLDKRPTKIYEIGPYVPFRILEEVSLHD